MIQLVRYLVFATFTAAMTMPPKFPSMENHEWHSAVREAGRLSVVKGRVETGFAWGRFVDAVNTTGFARLEVLSNRDAPPYEQAYAAGFVEGALTQRLIFFAVDNTWPSFFGTPLHIIPANVSRFIEENHAWTRQQIATASSDEEQYWRHVNYSFAQLDGLCDGYNSTAPSEEALLKTDVMVHNLIGDLGEITAKLRMTPSSELRGDTTQRHKITRCSALVKLTTDDVFISQVDWDDYDTGLLKVMKDYTLPYEPDTVHHIRFSSYPGLVYSFDDYYTTDADLTVIETSLDNYNLSLWEKVRPDAGVFQWVRTMVANRLGTSGESWTEINTRHSSGTGNQQWMVLDWKRVRVGQAQKGVLWVAETMPGVAVRKDMSELMYKQGYWPSYNIPFFPAIVGVCGTNPNGDWDSAPRAKIFARDHSSVQDLVSMQALMRSNHYQTDPLSLGDACSQIACRADLNKGDDYDCSGATDAKITSLLMRRSHGNFTLVNIASPSYDSQPIFQWKGQTCSERHQGQPGTWGFPWLTFA